MVKYGNHYICTSCEKVLPKHWRYESHTADVTTYTSYPRQPCPKCGRNAATKGRFSCYLSKTPWWAPWRWEWRRTPD